VEIRSRDLTCFVDPTRGSLGFWVLGFRGCRPMGLPMLRPFCKGCKSINKKECNVELVVHVIG
jgi:hypothetical protein